MHVSAEPRECVVFDIDDTLVLERSYVHSGFIAVGAWVATNLGVDGFAERAWSLFASGVRGNTFDAVLEQLELDHDDTTVTKLVEVYRTHHPLLELLHDARACLDQLAGDAAIAVVTDGPLESQRAKARTLGLAHWADPIVLTSDLGAGFGKPHRRAFEVVENATGVRGRRCTYVADNPVKDFAAPRAMGWRTIRVRRPESLHVDIPSGPDVDAEVDDLHDVLSLLNRLQTS